MTNSLSMKKIALVAAGLAIVFSAAFATTARAATAEELQAQISSLLAMIAGLQAQLSGGTTGTTTGGSCTAMQFTLTHKLGNTGGEVMNIQKFLNMDAATQVAATGVGSAGQETAYFGGLTKTAVIKFQNKYASEVLAPVGLSTGTGYWGASSRAKANALEIARCASTGTGTGTGTTTPTGAGITVSAAAQPGNSLAPQSAANVPFTKFTLTAGATAMTFDSVTVELTGLADKLSFASVALLDENGNQVGLTKTLNSNDQATIGETTTIPAGMSKTYTVVGNMKASLTNRAGEVAAFSVVAVNSSATVAGSLPITGAQHTINATLAIGSATSDRGVEDPNSSQSKEIGTANYKFQAVKITAGSAEDIRVKSVRWNQSGSASAGDMANVTLTFDGQTYTPSVSGDYYTFNFGSGVVIAKGLAKEMVLSADIINGSASAIVFDIRKDTDLVVSGETYGYGITPAAGSTAAASTSSSQFTTGTPWFDGATVTITGGSFNSVSKSNSAPAADIAELVASTVLGAFTVDIKGESITVETVKFGTQIGGGADASDLTNVTLVDQNGAVLAGPEDGVADAFASTGDAGGEGSISFSSVSFPTGVTTVFVKGQLSSDFAATDTVVVTTNPTDWTNATGDNTGDTITLANSLASANTMTVQAGTLSATTLTYPAASNVVAGSSDIVFATFSLDAANSGEDVKVTAVTLANVTTTGDSQDLDNVELWADLTAADSARGDKYETRVVDAEQWTGTGAATDTLALSLDSSITIAKNTSVEVAVVADLSSSSSTSDDYKVDVSTVTAVGLNTGSTISVTPTGAGQVMTVIGGGTVVAAVDASQPNAALLLDDSSLEQTLAVFKISETANAEDLDVDSIKITNSGTGTALVDTYKFYNGATLLGSAVGGSTTAELFLTDGSLTVPKNGDVKITVKAVMHNITTAADNGGTQILAIASGDLDTTGISSSSAVDTTAGSTGTDYTDTVFEAYPVFTFDTVNTALAAQANYLAAKIKVTNMGDRDITFTTTDRLFVTLAQSGFTASTVTGLEIRDADTGIDYAANADVDWTDGIDMFDTANPGGTLTVPANGFKTLEVLVNTAGLDGSTGGNDTVSVQLDTTGTDLTFTVNGVASGNVESTLLVPTLYGPTHSN